MGYYIKMAKTFEKYFGKCLKSLFSGDKKMRTRGLEPPRAFPPSGT
jgi:hypothetical protein